MKDYPYGMHIPMDMMSRVVFTIYAKTEEELTQWRDWLLDKTKEDLKRHGNMGKLY